MLEDVSKPEEPMRLEVNKLDGLTCSLQFAQRLKSEPIVSTSRTVLIVLRILLISSVISELRVVARGSRPNVLFVAALSK